MGVESFSIGVRRMNKPVSSHGVVVGTSGGTRVPEPDAQARRKQAEWNVRAEWERVCKGWAGGSITARAVAAEQRAETAELALAELRRRAWLHLEYTGGYTDHVSRDGLRTALRDEPTDLAEALRRELRATAFDEAAKIAEGFDPERESMDALVWAIERRAAELRGPK